ncbi:MAG: IS110 family transposase [Stellaceae bacterium]
MSVIDQSSPGQATIPGQHARIVASLELSPKKWLVTSLSPGSEKLSKRWIDGGDGEGLLALLRELQAKAERRVGGPVKVVSIYEAGLDGFWLHRLLELNGIESHVVDAGSIAAPRRKRRAKSDGIDGETLIRVLLAWLRREPRVCSMVRPPSIEEEDRRRLNREREALVRERTRETNRMRGLLMSQGVRDFNPLRRGARECLAGLTTGDGRPLPPRLLADLGRILDRITLLVAQIAEVEAASGRALAGAGGRDPAALLPQLRSLGQETTAVLAFEGFWRRFANRRQIGAYAGLAATPWRSGQLAHEQGIGGAGNPRLRKAMVQLAWLWLRHQPDSALSRWYRQRVGKEQGRVRRIAIVALARKLLVALWRYVTQGTIPEGAVLKSA